MQKGKRVHYSAGLIIFKWTLYPNYEQVATGHYRNVEVGYCTHSETVAEKRDMGTVVAYAVSPCRRTGVVYSESNLEDLNLNPKSKLLQMNTLLGLGKLWTGFGFGPEVTLGFSGLKNAKYLLCIRGRCS